MLGNQINAMAGNLFQSLGQWQTLGKEVITRRKIDQEIDIAGGLDGQAQQSRSAINKTGMFVPSG